MEYNIKSAKDMAAIAVAHNNTLKEDLKAVEGFIFEAATNGKFEFVWHVPENCVKNAPAIESILDNAGYITSFYPNKNELKISWRNDLEAKDLD